MLSGWRRLFHSPLIIRQTDYGSKLREMPSRSVNMNSIRQALSLLFISLLHMSLISIPKLQEAVVADVVEEEPHKEESGCTGGTTWEENVILSWASEINALCLPSLGASTPWHLLVLQLYFCLYLLWPVSTPIEWYIYWWCVEMEVVIYHTSLLSIRLGENEWKKAEYNEDTSGWVVMHDFHLCAACIKVPPNLAIEFCLQAS